MPPLSDRAPERLDAAPATESERLVAWLRLPAIALLAAGHGLAHPNPHDTAFFAAIVVFSAWSAAALAYVYLRRVTFGASVAAITVDVAAITTLALLSGGAFSQARLAYFLVPIAVAFRFRPSVTALAAASTVVAYLAQAFAYSTRSEAVRFIAIHAGYLLWVGLAAVLLSFVLARRTDRVAELAALRQRLIAEAITAEERERRALAEGLHDRAIQNLLSVRHFLEELEGGTSDPALQRAEDTLGETVEELREAIFELHPYVLDQAGLEAALTAIARRAAKRGGFRVHFELDYRDRHPHERLLVAAAQELLANVATHADASAVTVRLAQNGSELVLSVSDDGRGFDPAVILERLANGHIGLASQRARIESIGGRIDVHSSPGRGAILEVRVPRT